MYKESDIQDGPIHFPTEMSQEIYKAWLNFAPDKAIPQRNDIDPLLIPRKYMSSIWVYEYIEERDSYRQVIAGQNILDAWQETDGSPFLEDFMDDATAQNIIHRWNFLRLIPAIASYSITTDDEFQYTERIAIPLCDKSGAVKYIFGCSLYERLRGIESSNPPTDMDNVSLFRIE